MSSSKHHRPKELPDTLAELANLRDKQAAARFLRRHPDFWPLPRSPRRGVRLKVPPAVYGPPRPYIVRLVYWNLTHPASQRGHEEPPAPDMPVTNEESVIELRDVLRFIWRGGKDAEYALGELLAPLLPDWRGRGLAYKAKTPVQKALLELLKKSHLAKYCANGTCPAPYFVARHGRQKFCSPDCLAPFQRAWRRRWWKKHGQQYRAAKRKGSQTLKVKGGKP